MKKINLIITVLFLILNMVSIAQIPVLLGTTTRGGVTTRGNIFKINGDGTGFQSLYELQLATGGQPNGLFRANNGLFYGTARVGGLTNHGAIFCYNYATNTYTDLADLNGINGNLPSFNNNFM